jgi:hypothetical protein
MNAIPLVLSLSSKLLDVGALAAFAGLVGIAAVSLLIFSQARELKRLREWAERAPERAAELEKRVAVDAATRIQRAVKAVAAVPRPAPLTAARPALPAGPVPVPVPAPAAATGADGKPAEAPKVEEQLKVKEAQLANGTEGEPSRTVPATVAAAAAASAAGMTATRAAGPATPAPAPPGTPMPAPPAAGTPTAAVVPPAPGTPAPAVPASATGGPPGPVPATPVPVPATPVPATPAPESPPVAAKPQTPPATRPTLPPRPPAPVRPARTPLPGGGGRERVGTGAGYKFLREEEPSPRRARALIAGGIAGKPAKGSTQVNSASPGHPHGANGGANPGPSPAQTHVVVLNSTETIGLAHKLAGSLRQGGYTLAAPLVGKPALRSTSIVEYSSGHHAEAVSVGKKLGINETTPLEEAIAPLVGGATVVVIAGTDQATGAAAGETAPGAGETQGAGTGAGEAPAGGEAAGGTG